MAVGGYSDSGGSDDFSLVRYNPDGTLDTSFGGGDGMAFAGIVGRAEAMVLQADGKVVLSEYDHRWVPGVPRAVQCGRDAGHQFWRW